MVRGRHVLGQLIDPHLRAEWSQSIRLSDRVAAAPRRAETKTVGVDALELLRDAGAVGYVCRRVVG